MATPAQLALVWRCSETRAVGLLSAAQLLVELPGAFGLLESAAMTVEQSAVVVRVLEPLVAGVREAVWARVAAPLVADAEAGVQRPPARLGELVRRWVVQVDPASAVERRRRAEQRGEAVFRRREDGLVDLVLAGLTAPVAEACLSRITAGAVPFGVDDVRSAGKRRLDAAVDLLLGRTGRRRNLPRRRRRRRVWLRVGGGGAGAAAGPGGPDGVVVSLSEAVERPGRTDAQGVRAACVGC